MPTMEIQADGKCGHYGELLRRYPRVLELRQDIPIRVETLEGGMQTGKPSIAFIIELPQIGEVVLAQTSVKLFQMCAFVTFANYGDQTEGAVLGTFMRGGTAKLTLSSAAECPACHRQIPSSCKFCPECGGRL